MQFSIRPYTNSDTPHLVNIWNLHHHSSRRAELLTRSALEICVLSKPYFDSADIQIAFQGERPVGFVHCSFGPNSDWSDIDRSQGILNAICIVPCEEEDLIAKALFAAADDRFLLAKCRNTLAIGSIDRYAFYVGIAEGDGLLGVLAEDHRLQSWLAQAAFKPLRPTECWELDVVSFRSPMDRGQMAVRRSSSVLKMLDNELDNWWMAVALGHTEQVRFQLNQRHVSATSTLQSRKDVVFWHNDATISGQSGSVARLILPEPANLKSHDESERDQMLYLISESIRQLQQERFTTVRAIASGDKQESVNLLQRLGFRSVALGLQFERNI